MKKIDIQRIAEAARAHGERILDRWLPGGTRKGKEYLVRNPHRDDEHAGSLSIEIASGKGGDFATGETFGDYVGLVRFANQGTMSEAAEALVQFLGLPLSGAVSPAPTLPATKPKKTQADWHLVVPVPANAPPPPKAQTKRGPPSVVHEYRDQSGALLGFVWRHEARPPEHPRKDFYPLTFWESAAGKCEWRFAAWPAPRPLYCLHHLAARQSAIVVLHEGEKSADAGRRLMPDCVNMTWPNGASAAGKADFAPLKGRDVWLWADHDAPGTKAMRTVAGLLRKAGAASVRFINLVLFARYTSNADGRIGERLVPLPAGWDCADADTEGWTVAGIEHVLSGDGALLDHLPETIEEDGAVPDLANVAGAKNPDSPYQLEDDALYFCEKYKDKDDEWKERLHRICGPLAVAALARDAEGGSWGPALRLKDRDGRWRIEVIPYRLFLGDGTDGVKQLADIGLEIGSGRQTLDRIRNYILNEKPDRRAVLVDMTGWHGRAFVFPDSSIGETDETLMFRGNKRAQSAYAARGKLADWQTNIGHQAIGNPRLMFCLAVAFTGPLLKVIGSTSAIFHWYGDSSIGKSGALVAASSVWGPPEVQVHSWRHTSNALEGTAAQSNDCLLLLDEFKEVDAKEAAGIIYMLGNAKGKGRAHHAGGLRDTVSWRIVGMSSGELGMGDHLASVGQKHHAGQMVRFIELAADAGAGHGMWNDVSPLIDGGKQFTDLLKKFAGRYHGTAGRAFVTELCKRLDSIPAQWRQHDNAFVEDYKPTNAGGQVLRVMTAFSLVAFAGELAAQWQIVPWQQGAATSAAGSLFEEWSKERPSKGNSEDSQIVAHVRSVLERTWQSKFVDWHRTTEDRADLSRMAAVHDSLGFRKRDMPFDEENPQYLFYITRARFADEFAAKGSFKPKRVASLLKTRGVLNCDPDSTTLRETLPNGDPRSYCIVGSKLWALDA